MENKFRYTYSAPTERERKEAESIRKQYLVKEEKADNLAKLRALDKKVKDPPQILALSLGILGALVFGAGLSLILEFGQTVLGAFIALAGIIPLGFAFPSYKHMLKRRKERYREEILALSEEILKEE